MVDVEEARILEKLPVERNSRLTVEPEFFSVQKSE